MLTDYREQQLQDFIRSVEEMPDLKLYCLRQVYFDRLEENDCVDHELAKAFLDEIESEISARERRNFSVHEQIFRIRFRLKMLWPIHDLRSRFLQDDQSKLVADNKALNPAFLQRT